MSRAMLAIAGASAERPMDAVEEARWRVANAVQAINDGLVELRVAKRLLRDAERRGDVR